MPDRRTVLTARTLRRAMTKPEAALWQLLRARPGGLRFRRQHPVGRLVLDFYHPGSRTAIEVDGMAHDLGDNPARDERRDRWLAAEGISVMRLPARLVSEDIEAVLTDIVRRCTPPLHQPAAGPPPQAGLGEDEEGIR